MHFLCDYFVKLWRENGDFGMGELFLLLFVVPGLQNVKFVEGESFLSFYSLLYYCLLFYMQISISINILFSTNCMLLILKS